MNDTQVCSQRNRHLQPQVGASRSSRRPVLQTETAERRPSQRIADLENAVLLMVVVVLMVVGLMVLVLLLPVVILVVGAPIALCIRAIVEIVRDETLIPQHDGEQRVVNLQLAVVFDEPEFAELVHEEVDARSRRPHHLGQRLLRQFRQHAMRRTRFTIARQEQQGAGEPLFARAEELIDGILFDPDVPRQHVGEEAIRERRPGVQLPHHFFFPNDDDGGGIDCGRRRHPAGLAGQTAFTKEVSGVAAMARPTFLSTPRFSTAGAVAYPAIQSIGTVNERLVSAERELRVQFTRIAQLQAQLDVVWGALRRSAKGVRA
ncbi:MAG TPA: hypothetical protein VJP86_06450 [Vicinamibacterales bacterium]|nr:hypothetical protein [Vicinamibacterales bacterium]